MHDGTRYFALLEGEKYDFLCNRIRYIIRVKNGITFVISHNYTNIKVDSFDSLPLEKTLTFHKVITLIKSVFNKNRNHYHYNIFLEKGLYQLPKNSNNK